MVKLISFVVLSFFAASANAQRAPVLHCVAADGLEVTVDRRNAYMLPITIQSDSQQVAGQLINRRAAATINEVLKLNMNMNCASSMSTEGFSCTDLAIIDTSYQFLDGEDELTVARRLNSNAAVSIQRGVDGVFRLALKVDDPNHPGQIHTLQKDIGTIDSSGVNPFSPGCEYN